MVLPDRIYRHIPLFWMIMGILLLVAGLTATADFRLVAACLLLGLLCMGRSAWIYQARRRVVRQAEMTVLTETQRMESKPRDH